MSTCTSKYFVNLYQVSLKKYDKNIVLDEANIHKALVKAKSIIPIDALN